MDSKTYSTRIDPEDHDKALKIFNDLGFDWSSGIRIYLKQVIKKQGIPFELNDKEDSKLEDSIRKSLEEYAKGNYRTAHSTDELFKDLDKD